MLQKRLREGRYKKILLTPDELGREAPLIAGQISTLSVALKSGAVSAPEAAAIYIITYQKQRKAWMWLGGPHGAAFQDNLTAEEHSKLNTAPTVRSVFAELSVRGVPLSVNRALVRWASGRYPLMLTTVVPSPFEILEMQTRGERCVTMITDPEQLGNLVLQQRDPLGFLLHDLIHADKFYRNTEILAGQIGFSRFVHRAWIKNKFTALAEDDPAFKRELDYVASDMNSYCVHLLKCLKAVCLGAFLRKEGKAPNDRLSTTGESRFSTFYLSLFDGWGANDQVLTAALALNGPLEEQFSVSPPLLEFFTAISRQPMNSFVI